jgi:hypothetical protein
MGAASAPVHSDQRRWMGLHGHAHAQGVGLRSSQACSGITTALVPRRGRHPVGPARDCVSGVPSTHHAVATGPGWARDGRLTAVMRSPRGTTAGPSISPHDIGTL